MSDQGPDEEREQEQERRRPRVVDKRVSTRPSQTPDPEPARAREEPEGPAPSFPGGPAAGAAPPSAPSEAGAVAPPPEGGEGGRLWTPEEEEEARALARQIAETPSRDWVLNAAVTLVNVAATKLDAGQVEEAKLPIDGLSALLSGIGAELGDAEKPLRQTLAQLQMAYAQAATPPPGGPVQGP